MSWKHDALYLSWAEFKSIVENCPLPLNVWWVAEFSGEEAHQYFMAFKTPVSLHVVEVYGDDATHETTGFENWSYKSDDYECDTRDGAIAQAMQAAMGPYNKALAPITEAGDAIFEEGAQAITVISHDKSDPTTWYQNSTLVENEELSLVDGETDLYESDNINWINEDHPHLVADEFLQADGVTWKRLHNKVGDLYAVGHFRPVVQFQIGGTGDWVTKAPDDATYGHRFDYANGQVKAINQAEWAEGTKIRATYYHATSGTEGSAFEVGPPAGKVWRLSLTDVQLSKGSQWNNTMYLEGTQEVNHPEYGLIKVVGRRTRYKTYANMQSTASSIGWTVDGSTPNPADWPPDEENGWVWPEDHFDGYRNLETITEVVPWNYRQVKEMYGDLKQTMKVRLGPDGSKFTNCKLANITYYIKETNE
jgi:hypothetical protein